MSMIFLLLQAKMRWDWVYKEVSKVYELKKKITSESGTKQTG